MFIFFWVLKFILIFIYVFLLLFVSDNNPFFLSLQYFNFFSIFFYNLFIKHLIKGLININLDYIHNWVYIWLFLVSYKLIGIQFIKFLAYFVIFEFN